jgi:hypothetical protein
MQYERLLVEPPIKDFDFCLRFSSYVIPFHLSIYLCDVHVQAGQALY